MFKFKFYSFLFIYFLGLFSNSSLLASNEDISEETFGWDATKVAATAIASATASVIVAPVALQMTKSVTRHVSRGAERIYDRSEISPHTYKMFDNIGIIGCFASMSSYLLPKMSHRAMPIEEVLPDTMNPHQLGYLKQLDKILSDGITDSETLGKRGWMKQPVYGQIGEFKPSLTEYLMCGLCSNQDYLYGYEYTDSVFTVRIQRYFNQKHINEVDLKDFYKINPYFKSLTGGKIQENPKYRIIYAKAEDDIIDPIINQSTIFENKNIEKKKFIQEFLEYEKGILKLKKEPLQLDKCLERILELSLYNTRKDKIDSVYHENKTSKNLYFLFLFKLEGEYSDYSLLLQISKNLGLQESENDKSGRLCNSNNDEGESSEPREDDLELDVKDIEKGITPSLPHIDTDTRKEDSPNKGKEKDTHKVKKRKNAGTTTSSE